MTRSRYSYTNRMISYKTTCGLAFLVAGFLNLTGCQFAQSLIRNNHQTENLQASQIQEVTMNHQRLDSLSESQLSDANVRTVSYQELPRPENDPQDFQHVAPAEQEFRPYSPMQESYERQTDTHRPGTFPSENQASAMLNNNGGYSRGPVYEGTELNRPRQKPATQVALELRYQNLELKEKIAELESENRDLRENNSKCEIELAQRHDRIGFLENELTRFTQENDKLTQQLGQLANHLTQSNARHQKDIHELNQTIIAFEKLLLGLENNVDGETLDVEPPPENKPNPTKPTQLIGPTDPNNAAQLSSPASALLQNYGGTTTGDGNE